MHDPTKGKIKVTPDLLNEGIAIHCNYLLSSAGLLNHHTLVLREKATTLDIVIVEKMHILRKEGGFQLRISTYGFVLHNKEGPKPRNCEIIIRTSLFI